MEHLFQKIWSSKGGKDELISLYQAFYADLYAYGFRISNHQEMTRDAIHDLFIQLWEKKIDPSEILAPKPYLLKALRNTLIDALKRNRREAGSPEESILGYELSGEEIIITDELSVEKRRKLKQSILNLPVRQKEVVYLRYYEGMDYQEIAAITNTKNQSVRNLMSKALTELRKHFIMLLFLLAS